MIETLFAGWPLVFALYFINIILAITFHEYTHLWAASKLWDNTGEIEWRMNLNPLNHLDPFGTILIFLIWFGWWKPAPINFYKFKNPERDFMISALAWPASNFFLVVLFAFTLKFLNMYWLNNYFNEAFLQVWIMINIWLGVFNLLPIPPLDWSRVLRRAFRNNYRFLSFWNNLENQIFLPFIVLWLFWGIIYPIIVAITHFVYTFI